MKNTRRFRPWLTVLFGALATTLVTVPPGAAGDELRNLSKGDSLPTFELKTLQGGDAAAKDYEGKVLVLVYLSARQRSSERAAVTATEIVGRHAGDGVELLFMTADVEHAESFEEQWQEHGFTAPLALDEDRSMYGTLGLIVFPTTLVVDPKGKLAHVILTRRTNYGHALDAYVRHGLRELDDEELAELLAAKDLDRASPRVLAQRHRAAARLLREKGLLDGAEAELKLATEFDPGNAHVLLDLADLYAASGRLKEGEALARSVLEAEPGQKQARMIMGIIHFKSGRLDESEAELQTALHHNPDPARTHYYLGRVYEERDELQRALEHYRGALDRLLNE